MPTLKYRNIAPGVREYPDGRQLCSKSALETRKKRLLSAGQTCIACGGTFNDFREVELAHIQSKGMGGSKRDDRWGNLVLMHKTANRAQGSKPLDAYIIERGGKDCPR